MNPPDVTTAHDVLHWYIFIAGTAVGVFSLLAFGLVLSSIFETLAERVALEEKKTTKARCNLCGSHFGYHGDSCPHAGKTQ